MPKPITPPSPQAVLAPPRGFAFLSIEQTIKLRGISRSSHYADINARLFPKPVKIRRRAVAHPEHEVDALNAATAAGKSPDEIRDLVLALEAARTANV